MLKLYQDHHEIHWPRRPCHGDPHHANTKKFWTVLWARYLPMELEECYSQPSKLEAFLWGIVHTAGSKKSCHCDIAACLYTSVPSFGSLQKWSICTIRHESAQHSKLKRLESCVLFTAFTRAYNFQIQTKSCTKLQQDNYIVMQLWALTPKAETKSFQNRQKLVQSNFSSLFRKIDTFSGSSLVWMPSL